MAGRESKEERGERGEEIDKGMKRQQKSRE
jgi:hypothetical protein